MKSGHRHLEVLKHWFDLFQCPSALCIGCVATQKACQLWGMPQWRIRFCLASKSEDRFNVFSFRKKIEPAPRCCLWKTCVEEALGPQTTKVIFEKKPIRFLVQNRYIRKGDWYFGSSKRLEQKYWQMAIFQRYGLAFTWPAAFGWC